MSTLKVNSIQNTSGANNLGRILQVKQTVMDNNLYWANMTDWEDVTGLNATITPATTSSKILVSVQCKMATAHNGDCVAALALKRGGSLLSYTTNSNWGYGDYHMYFDENDDTLGGPHGTFTRLDSPSTTSATTYQVVTRSGGSGWSGNNLYINRSNRSDNYWYNCAYVRSTITLMEVSA